MAAMPVRELNRDTYTFSYKRFDYSIYTFMTPDGILCYRFWRKMDEGASEAGRGQSRSDPALEETIGQPLGTGQSHRGPEVVWGHASGGQHAPQSIIRAS
jgi:hypothetical protein